MTELLLASAAVAGLSWTITGQVCRHAHTLGLIDSPNERSSHQVPTPRGGGLSIVLAFLLGLGWLAWTSSIDTRVLNALWLGGVVVAGIGLIDDRRPLPARWRLACHLAAAGWCVWQLGPPPVPHFLGSSYTLTWLGAILAALYVGWTINYFNFMDGIDGIAASEALVVALGGALCAWLALPGDGWVLPVVFAASVAGFLMWNFPPAKIFMGDVGSGFIGFVVGCLSLWAGHSATHLFWAWFILVGCFFADAATTLIRRVLRGERFYEAHRLHAYQYAARRLGSHRVVTLGFAAVTAFWLLPLAALVAMRRVDTIVCVVLAYLPLVSIAFVLKAGDRRAQGV